MARQLTSVPNTDAPDATYPAGRIRNDNAPTTEGTAVIEEVYGDLIQFFHKLMRLAGLTYNDLAENESSGFQFITALTTVVRALQATTDTKGTSELATPLETEAGIDTLRTVTPNGFLTALRNKLKLYLGNEIETITGSGEYQLTNNHGAVNIIVNAADSFNIILRMTNAAPDNKGKIIPININTTLASETATIVIYNATTGTTELFNSGSISPGTYKRILLLKSNGTSWSVIYNLNSIFEKSIQSELLSGTENKFPDCKQIYDTKIVDRGDMSSNDFTESILLQDNAWHDLNLSSLIPSGFRFAILKISAVSLSGNGTFLIRTKGNLNDVNSLDLRFSTTENTTNGIVLMNSSRIVEYKINVPNPGAVSVNVVAWM